jgi:beta-galactosidase
MFPVEYTIDLPPSQSTVLTVAARTLGVGSAGCGPQPLDPYRVRSGPETFSYVLRLLPAGQKNLAAAGRQTLPPDRVKPALEKLAGAKSEPKGTVISASSFEPGEGELEHAVDGDEQTFWHSHWSGEAAQPPHFLVIDYGQPLNLDGMLYVARADKENGRVKDYEIYLSSDGQEWGKPAAQGSFRRDASEEIIQLRRPVRARYVKLVALGEQNGKPFAAVAELEAIVAGQ